MSEWGKSVDVIASAETTGFPRFVVTRTGHTTHISDDRKTTRCGRPVVGLADADDVVWFWPPCQKCTRGDEA